MTLAKLDKYKIVRIKTGEVMSTHPTKKDAMKVWQKLHNTSPDDMFLEIGSNFVIEPLEVSSTKITKNPIHQKCGTEMRLAIIREMTKREQSGDCGNIWICDKCNVKVYV